MLALSSLNKEIKVDQQEKKKGCMHHYTSLHSLTRLLAPSLTK